MGGPVGLGAPGRAGRAPREAQGPRSAACERTWAQVRDQASAPRCLRFGLRPTGARRARLPLRHRQHDASHRAKW